MLYPHCFLAAICPLLERCMGRERDCPYCRQPIRPSGGTCELAHICTTYPARQTQFPLPVYIHEGHYYFVMSTLVGFQYRVVYDQTGPKEEIGGCQIQFCPMRAPGNAALPRGRALVYPYTEDRTQRHPKPIDRIVKRNRLDTPPCFPFQRQPRGN